MKSPHQVLSLEEWRRVSPSPVTHEWLARLDELLDAKIKSATGKVTEIGLPDCLRDWVSEYTGLNERGCHLWKGSIRTGGDDHSIFWRNADHQATQQGMQWRMVDRWCDGYRTVLICPQHHLTLTYCEGDLSLVHAPSRSHYAAELKDAARFYLTH